MQSFPGLDEPLTAALAGVDDSDRLHGSMDAENKIASVVPIRDAAGERLLGALVLIALAPTPASVIFELAPIDGVGLLVLAAVAGLAGAAFGMMAACGLVNRLERLSNATLAWRGGELDVRVSDPSGDELGQLTGRLNHMAEELRALFEMRRDLAIVNERNRLARDLHDSVKQQAFAANAQLGAARAVGRRT